MQGFPKRAEDLWTTLQSSIEQGERQAAVRLLDDAWRQLSQAQRAMQAWELAVVVRRDCPSPAYFFEHVLSTYLTNACNHYQSVEFILLGSLLRQPDWRERAGFLRAQYAPWPFVLTRLYIAAHATTADLQETAATLQRRPSMTWETLLRHQPMAPATRALLELHDTAMQQLLLHNAPAVLRVAEFWAERFVGAIADDAEAVRGTLIDGTLRQEFVTFLLTAVRQAPVGVSQRFSGRRLPDNLPGRLRHAFAPGFRSDSPWDFAAALPQALDQASSPVL